MSLSMHPLLSVRQTVNTHRSLLATLCSPLSAHHPLLTVAGVLTIHFPFIIIIIFSRCIPFSNARQFLFVQVRLYHLSGPHSADVLLRSAAIPVRYLRLSVRCVHVSVMSPLPHIYCQSHRSIIVNPSPHHFSLSTVLLHTHNTPTTLSSLPCLKCLFILLVLAPAAVTLL